MRAPQVCLTAPTPEMNEPCDDVFRILKEELYKVSKRTEKMHLNFKRLKQ
ncbi:MAG: hypothetical protein JWM68_1246 [Verrucomicrobiales bacterium]|nr:hypothetical protein [Verrucomicrobiales bacterium]